MLDSAHDLAKSLLIIPKTGEMDKENIQILMTGATLLVAALTLGFSAWKPITGFFRRNRMRRRLDKHYPEFEEKLGGQIWTQLMDIPAPAQDAHSSLELSKRKALISKIKRDFIKNLKPKNEKESELFSTAVERYEKAMWGHASEADGLNESLAVTRAPSDKETLLWNEIKELRKAIKTELYHDILY